ncbi:hypothetical protein A5906_06495 [Bradyrhizobium sacchari]|uniref:hypothetical protein n=1 Tax=Bradyrhizobium sacchari TaxID=1399419 RepID=UPI0009CFD628|nr:hypothetical protein [Bradyrhizobium sacchari]OPY95634.1 hypothetical protein A5906_06495 [Bradyrhizobium sacchari]
MAALDARRIKLVLGTSPANLAVAFGRPVSWCARLGNAFTIILTDKDDDKSMRVFRRVVTDAVANADDDDDVMPRRFAQWSIPCVSGRSMTGLPLRGARRKKSTPDCAKANRADYRIFLGCGC